MSTTLLGPSAWAQEAPSKEAQNTAEESDRDPLTEEAERLLSTVSELAKSRDELLKRTREATGEDKLILERQTWQQQVEINTALRGLVGNVIRQEKDGRDVGAVKKDVQKRIELGTTMAVKIVGQIREHLSELRVERDKAEAKDLISLETQITREERLLQELFGMIVGNLISLQQLGTDTKKRELVIEGKVAERAECGTTPPSARRCCRRES